MIVLDRLEGNVGIIEKDGKIIHVPISQLSPLAKEGDLLILRNGMYYVDEIASLNRRRLLRKRFNKLKGGK